MAKKLKYRVCSVCGKEFPLTRKFFKRNNDSSFHEMCRECEDHTKHDAEWKDGLLKCHKCGKFLPVDKFASSDHYPYRDHHDARCRDCRTKRANERKKEYSDEYGLLKVLQMRYLAAKDRANKKGLPFNITKEYLKEKWDEQNGKCAVCGIPMTFEQCNGRTPTNVSIDQISHKEGYIVGNVQLVCMAINQMKSDMEMNDLYMFCEAILENKNNKQILK